MFRPMQGARCLFAAPNLCHSSVRPAIRLRAHQDTCALMARSRSRKARLLSASGAASTCLPPATETGSISVHPTGRTNASKAARKRWSKQRSPNAAATMSGVLAVRNPGAQRRHAEATASMSVVHLWHSTPMRPLSLRIALRKRPWHMARSRRLRGGALAMPFPPPTRVRQVRTIARSSGLFPLASLLRQVPTLDTRPRLAHNSPHPVREA
jgi:hypothetical protein